MSVLRNHDKELNNVSISYEVKYFQSIASGAFTVSGEEG